MATPRLIASAVAAAILFVAPESAAQGGYNEEGPEPGEITTYRDEPERVPVKRDAQGRAVAASVVKSNVLYFGPLSVLFGHFPIEYERAFSNWGSFAILGAVNRPYGFLGVVKADPNESQSSGEIGGAFRTYFFGTAPSGFFAGPEVLVGHATVTRFGTTGRAVTLHVTGLVGYALVTESGFAFSVGAGALLQTGQSLSPNFQLVSRVVPAVRAHLGYAF